MDKLATDSLISIYRFYDGEYINIFMKYTVRIMKKQGSIRRHRKSKQGATKHNIKQPKIRR